MLGCAGRDPSPGARGSRADLPLAGGLTPLKFGFFYYFFSFIGLVEDFSCLVLINKAGQYMGKGDSLCPPLRGFTKQHKTNQWQLLT
jgi:hypothetical protein